MNASADRLKTGNRTHGFRRWISGFGEVGASSFLSPSKANKYTLYGMASSTAASYALHRLGHTSIAQLAQTTAAPIFSSIPIFGSVIGATVAQLGLWGIFATSSLMLGVCLTLCSNTHERQNIISGWLFSHAALALCFAPAWGTLTVTTLPILAGMAVGLFAVSSMLTSQLDQDTVTWTTLAASLTLAIACGPLASSTALGRPLLDQIAPAFLTTAVGMVLSGLYHLQQHWSVFKTPSTDFVQNFVTEPPKHLRLDLPGVEEPTVFGSTATPQVSNLIDSMHLALAKRRPIGLRTLLLYGPPGTGKTVTAQALANHLNMIFVAPDATKIFADAHPSQRVVQIFDEARALTQQLRQPALIFFDESENLFRKRDHAASGTDDARRANLITQAFLTELQGVSRHHDTNLFIVSATNKPEWLDNGIFTRFYNRLELGLPDLETMTKILEITCHAQLREEKGLDGYLLEPLSIDKKLLRKIASYAHEHNLPGRTLDQIAMRFSNAVAAKVFQDRLRPRGLANHSILSNFYNKQLRLAEETIQREGKSFFDPPPIADTSATEAETEVDIDHFDDTVQNFIDNNFPQET